MCGIAGLACRQDRIRPEWILAMTRALRHRGPDDEGYLAADLKSNSHCSLSGGDSKVDLPRIEEFRGGADLFLGHRRLSVIDTSSAGHQPMGNRDGSVWIVFNGEVYNYPELRAELESSGARFRTNTDTEVILAAYERLGSGCVERFNGMWSFVIFDRRKKILFGSRDRFGVKPLYYFHDAENFAFASEIKSLMTLPLTGKKINPAAVFDYLVFGLQEMEEEGFFAGIRELPPSHNFELDLRSGALEISRYYRMSYNESWEAPDLEKLGRYINETQRLISSAVRLRLRSDVPVGSCLSGGIDSSTIVCLVNRMLMEGDLEQVGKRQRVFTASYDDSRIDESAWAEAVVSHTKTIWHRTFPAAAELRKDLEELVYTQDIPFGSTSIYAQYRVMKLAAQAGVKVLLDGQGADELFGGYPVCYKTFAAEMLARGDISGFVSGVRHLGNSPIKASALFLDLLKLCSARLLPDKLVRTLFARTSPEINYVSRDLLAECESRLHMIREKTSVSLNQMLYRLMAEQNLKSLLRYEDRNSMRFSIEARTPFADDVGLIEYVFGIPSVYKIRDGWSKYLLRQSVRGLVPEEIRLRKDKIGFATPERLWLAGLKNELKEYMTDDLDDYFNVGKMKNEWDNLIDGSGAGSVALWRFVNFAVWKKVYAV